MFKKLGKTVFSSLLTVAVVSVSALSVSAINHVEELKNHSLGIVGTFNGWTDDVPMKPVIDKNGDTVYEGIVEIDKLTEDMFKKTSHNSPKTIYYNDDGSGVVEAYDDTYIHDDTYTLEFRIRLDGTWADQWGDYDGGNIFNSDKNFVVKEAELEKPLKFKVIFNPTQTIFAVATQEPTLIYWNGDDLTYRFRDSDDGLMYPKITYEILPYEPKEESSQSEQSQTEESSQPEQSQTEESSQSEQSQMEESSQPEQSQTEESSQLEQSQTEESPQPEQSKTEESSNNSAYSDNKNKSSTIDSNGSGTIENSNSNNTGKNNVVPVPNTSDNTNMFVIALVFMVSIISSIIVIKHKEIND